MASAHVIRSAVNRKWRRAEQKQWWYEKLSAVRRNKTIKLYDRQEGRCCYCKQLTAKHQGHHDLPKKKLATLEHITPQSKGGTDHESNLLMSCMACNVARGDMDHHKFILVRSDPDRWRAFLRNKSKLYHLATKKAANNTKKKEAKRLARRRVFVAKLAVLFIVCPEWEQTIMPLVSARLADRNERLKKELEDSLFDFDEAITELPQKH